MFSSSKRAKYYLGFGLLSLQDAKSIRMGEASGWLEFSHTTVSMLDLMDSFVLKFKHLKNISNEKYEIVTYY